MNKRPLDEVRINKIEDLFLQPELGDIRTIGVVSDPNEGKTNLMNHLIDIFRTKATNTRLVSFRLPAHEGVFSIHSVAELERVHDSVIFMDEWADLVDTTNRKQARAFERTIRTIYHPFSNNILFLAGMARNFNGKVSGMMHAFIFKSLTLADAVQRSTIYNILMQYDGGFQVKKGADTLTMPKNVALVKIIGGRFDEVEIPYVAWGDTKANRPAVVRWNEEPKKIKGK